MTSILHVMNAQIATSDQVFHALGDATRRAIVVQLGNGPASVSELARPLPISLAAVVQHVQVLEASGLVATRKEGRVRTCHLVPDALVEAERWLAQRRALWVGRLDRLGGLLHGVAPALDDTTETAVRAPSTRSLDAPSEEETP
jgi:DNA-binding transcriptional ArsR family regulator